MITAPHSWGFLFVGWLVDLEMIRHLLLLIFIGVAYWGCDKKGIINGGHYKNDNLDRLNTYYLYDFISKGKVEKHAMESAYTKGSTTANYYFSYNSNIPSHSLELVKSLSEANKLIDDYSYNIKYAFIRNKSGEMKFVDCSESPNDKLCNP